MPVLFSPDGELTSTNNAVVAPGYEEIKIGAPLGVELRNFFPGPNIKEWNNKAELMISSQVRLGPQDVPPPKRVNIMVMGYPFKNPEPILGVAGHNYGDMMLYYTKAYTGGRLGMTLRGTELDKIGKKRFAAITNAMGQIGKLAMFSSAAPYLAAASIAVATINLLVRAFSRNDPVLTVPTDLRFKPKNGGVLQAGRYLFWDGAPGWQTFANQYEIDSSNILVRKSDGAQYLERPYLVVEVDGQEKPSYADFEIGAQSAELLEQWGDKDAASTTLNAIVDLARQVNDARQLGDAYSEVKNLRDADTDEERALIKQKIKAHVDLMTDGNRDFIKDLLDSTIGG